MISYWNDTSLHGNWVYDDAGSVAKNVVVIGKVPTMEVFKRDFWGTPMNQPASHKSFRPVTTLSFRLNYLFSQLDNTYWYHATNVVLHGIVSGLVTKMSTFLFRSGESTTNVIAQLVTGFLFGLHPIHAEVVSNITSRGEMLMSLFYILAIWSYASATNTLQQSQPPCPTTIWTFLKMYVFPALCMALSLFSKEQGATALISSVLFDFLTHYSSVVEYIQALFQKQQDAISFFKRTTVLAIQTLLLVAWRIHLNGESSQPDFIVDQNPAGFASDRFTRIFSINWVYCLYIYDIVYPKYLCPDWSGKSIDLIHDWNDVRILAVVLLWIVVGACVVSLVFGIPNKYNGHHHRRVVLLAVFACTLSPFLLSSNLLVVVGLMKADRVMYLPLFGFCLLEALLVKSLYETKSRWRLLRIIMTHLLLLLQLALYGIKVHERNIAWSHSLFLWMSAYEINPRSYHTMYNCGYELSLKQQYELAENIMRPIASARVDGPSNTFVYAMILFNLGDCETSLEYVEEALNVIEEKKKMGGPRNEPHQLARTTSNLLVAKAHCVPSFSERGKILYEAVQVDPQNDYAIQQAQGLMERVNLMKQHGLEIN
jgi:hypothetical protein